MPAIPLWPPPRDRATNAELLAAAEARDPFGHGVHLLLAGAFCALGGISTATLEISAAILVVFAALRLPHTWRTYPAFLGIGAILAFLVWTAWAAISLAWSLDPIEGWRQFNALRMALVVPALWPLMRHRRALAGCLVAGMCFQTFGQALDLLGLLKHREDNLNRYIGFGSHPGHVTLWLSMAAMTAIALLRGASRGMRVLLGVATIALVIGAFVGGGRGSLIGLALGGATLLVSTLATTRLTAAQWLTGGAISVVLVGAIALTRGDDIALAVQRARDQLQRSQERGDPRGSAAYRVYWWGLTLDEWSESKVIGTGFGSWQRWARSNPETVELAAKLKTTPEKLILAHPHSMYLQTLAETGAVGALLTLLVAIAIARRAVPEAKVDPVALAGLAALVVWAASAAFEGNHVSPRSTAPFALAFAMAVLPSLLPRREPGSSR